MGVWKNVLYFTLTSLILLVIWEYGAVISHMPPFLLPRPTQIAESLVLNKAEFLRAAGVTLGVTLCGLSVSVCVAFGVAIAVFFLKIVGQLATPYLIFFQIMPLVSIVPLLMIWLKNNTVLTLVICTALSCFFPLVTSFLSGLRQANPSLLAIFRLYQSSFWQTLWKLYVPSLVPFFLNGLQIAAALALIGEVSSEFIVGTGGHRSGVAYILLMSGYNLQTETLFAALFVILLLGLFLHLVCRLLTYALCASRRF